MAINRIIKLGLEEEANALKSQGMSDYQIAKELSERSGQRITQSTVWRYFNKNKDPVINRIKQREGILTKAVNGRINSLEQLITINEETITILQEAKIAGELRTALKAIERIEKQLELQAKLLGDISNQPIININLIQNQFNEFKQLILEVMCSECRSKLETKLHQIMGQ
jgi:predicted transcriptional regulator